MKTKITNVTFVAVLILAFSVYVAGLNDSADADGDTESVTAASDGTFGGGDPADDEGDGTVEAAPDATPTRTPTPINVGNFVWDDLDDDGRQDAGEPGLSGVQVQLWNGAKNDLIDTATTNANGNYTLVAPTPGDYRVRVILASGADAFSPKDQAGGNDQQDSDINPSGANTGFTDVYTFGSNLISITTIDAGVNRFTTPTPTRTPTPINVGNFVWDDLDDDGRQDAGEPGLSGVQVQLWNGAKNDLIDTATTNANGNYTLVAPTPGDYRVRVLLPNVADAFSPKDQAGGNDQQDSDINPSGANAGFTDVYTFGSNLISITTIDAGINRFTTPTPTRTPTPINIGNFVWDDQDGDGRQDAGEPGIPDVTVQLWNSAKTSLIDQDTTNANGNYTVVAPLPGDYRVRVLLPGSGTSFSPKEVGADTQDSNINPSGANTGFTDVISIASNVISISSVDAGILGYDSSTTTTSSTSSSTTSSTSTTTSTTLPGGTSTTSTTLPGSTSTTSTTLPGGSTTSSSTTAVGETTTTDGATPTSTLPGPDGPPDAFYLDDGQLTKSQTVEAGQPVTLTLGGAAPGSAVEVILYSDPVSLGQATAGSDGSFVEPFTIPARTPVGLHEISLVGETAAGVPFDLRLDLTVVAPGTLPTSTTPSSVADGSLPRTGTDGTDRMVAIGLTLLGAGIIVIALRRRATGRPA